MGTFWGQPVCNLVTDANQHMGIHHVPDNGLGVLPFEAHQLPQVTSSLMPFLESDVGTPPIE